MYLHMEQIRTESVVLPNDETYYMIQRASQVLYFRKELDLRREFR